MAPLLSLSDLTRRFGGLTAVNGVSFDVAEGEVVGLLGPNGSGKTTALNMISGALKPSAGQIRLRGEPIGGLSAHRVARRGDQRVVDVALHIRVARDHLGEGHGALLVLGIIPTNKPALTGFPHPRRTNRPRNRPRL